MTTHAFAGPARHRALAPWLTGALCLAMLAAALWLLHRVTLGFEAWSYEDRRQRMTAAGAFAAPAVALRDASGQPLVMWREDAARPAAYLVDFIYTRCAGVCRALGSEYQQMQRQLAASADPGAVHLVSISFDVEYDDPRRLAEQARRLHADPARWTFALPATAADARRLLAGLGVIAIPDGQGGFVHNGDIHLLDERGRLHGVFAFEQWQDALAAAARLAALPPPSPS